MASWSLLGLLVAVRLLSRRGGMPPLATWVGLGLMLMALIMGLSLRPRGPVAEASQRKGTPAPRASVRTATAPTAPEAIPATKPDRAPDVAAPLAEPEAISDTAARRGFGYLTVHSLAAYANVYVMFNKYGVVERRLEIPCGQRFIAIGVPAPGKREPIWLAPGKKTFVPCGGSLELTMNPRALR